MRVGITYDLRDDYLAAGYSVEETAEFDSVVTIDGIDAALGRLGFETVRIGNIRQLAARLVAGERWDFVFNFAEGLHGAGREGQVPALLDAFEVPYTFSDPLVMGITLDKSLAKRVARDAGVRTAPFAVVHGEGDIARIEMPFPLFTKPIAEGTGKGVAQDCFVTTSEQLASVCRRILDGYRQAVLVEQYLSGREFTVGITGTGSEAEIIGVMEIIPTDKSRPWIYSFENKQDWTDRIAYRLADDEEGREAGAVALAAYRAIGCRDCGRVDVRSDGAGTPHFLEVNPLPGLKPGFSDLPVLAEFAGVGFDALIGRIVQSCMARHHLEAQPFEMAAE